jgi:predicted SAM-dependent methyltransferase
MDKLTLNVGCGMRTFREYPKGHKCINYDKRPLSNVDRTGDVRELPWQDNFFDYILASDIIEHFPIKETEDVLREWLRVLKPAGVIEFRLPNLEAICKDYVKRIGENRGTGEPMAHYFSWLLYGGQDYPGNFHYVGFDRRLFKYMCEKVGMVEISWKAEGYNMITKYRRNDA